MPIFKLNDEILFPDTSWADDPSGIFAVGGDLSEARLLLAYSMGIFPWYNEDTPILWHVPVKRMVLLPHQLHVSRSLRKALRRGHLEVRYDTAFPEVIRACAEIPREDQDGTWINEDMIAAYIRLHEIGYAHSAEAWLDGALVGGLYGVAIGAAFFGESMFSRVSNASKIAFVTAVRDLADLGYGLIDCQLYTDHLAQFGAREWTRRRFLETLPRFVSQEIPQAWPT